MDPDSLRKAITPKTKAIVPVHLYGHAAPMAELLRIANEHNLFVIEDNAQAIGCDYHFSDGRVAKTGTLGHIGCTSFYPSKNLGAYGDGGAIFTNDSALAERLRMIANHGQRQRYYHEIVGCNSRLDSVQAAILRIKLRHLDAYNEARRSVADFYDQAFATHPLVTTPFQAVYSKHVYHQYTLKLAAGVDRDGLVKYLADRSIPSMIYYPVPGHRQPMFAEFGSAEHSMPITDALTDVVISLPIHTEMDEEQKAYIANAVLEYLNK
jgi:dTDP-4-amino-4,6-dideoxygalactose transaminase